MTGCVEECPRLFCVGAVVSERNSAAQPFMALAQSCSNSGVLLNTVSKSVTALDTRYLTNIQNCQAALKKANKN